MRFAKKSHAVTSWEIRHVEDYTKRWRVRMVEVIGILCAKDLLRMTKSLELVAVGMALVRSHWHYALMFGLASRMLKLDGGVHYVEAVSQAMFHVAQNGVAFRKRNVRNDYVA